MSHNVGAGEWLAMLTKLGYSQVQPVENGSVTVQVGTSDAVTPWALRAMNVGSTSGFATP